MALQALFDTMREVSILIDGCFEFYSLHRLFPFRVPDPDGPAACWPDP
jgi:hypothetical protein